jgi:hypothetical protein
VPPELRCNLIGKEFGSILFLKMVQSEDFSYHHDRDLDKHVIAMAVENLTSGLQTKKRLFFNKSACPIGFINIAQNDEVEVTVVRNGQAEEEVIQKYRFQLQGEYLVGRSPNCEASPPIQLITWAPTQIGMTLNYDGDKNNGGAQTTLPYGGGQQAMMGGFNMGIM